MGCCLKWINGVLSTKDCDGNWVPIPGNGPVGGGQPGGGSPQPQPGECVSYDAIIPGRGWWLLPTIVHVGDVLTLSATAGATYQSAKNEWMCPDGSQFFGTCLSYYKITDAGALVPSEPVGSLVVGLSHEGSPFSGEFFAIDPDTGFTVPGGYDGYRLILVTNYVTSSDDNAGNDTATVQYCNNAAVQWCRRADFLLSPYGFVLTDEGGGDKFGEWDGGQGWVATDGIREERYVRRLDVTATFNSTTITSLDLMYAYELGDIEGTAATHGLLISFDGSPVIDIPFAEVPTGSANHAVWGGSAEGTTSIDIYIESDNAAGNTQRGTANALSLIVNGQLVPISAGVQC